jgi:hypothetical protein
MVYRNTDGTGAETTSYAYTWFPNTVGEQSVTTTAPVISAGQNGPGVADVSTVFFDGYGHPVWSRGANGYPAGEAGTGGMRHGLTAVLLAGRCWPATDWSGASP